MNRAFDPFDADQAQTAYGKQKRKDTPINNKKQIRLCPKCGSRDVFVVGGVHKYECLDCKHYFDTISYLPFGIGAK